MSTHETTTDTPTITLAGRRWDLPTLAPKQNRIVVPALIELIPKILRARASAGEGPFALFACCLDTASYDLLTGAVFAALTRAHPRLVRAEFDALPIDTAELIHALPPIARAAGLIRGLYGNS